MPDASQQPRLHRGASRVASAPCISPVVILRSRPVACLPHSLTKLTPLQGDAMLVELNTKILEVLEKHEAEVLAEWIKEQIGATTLRPDLLREGELREQCTKFIRLLREAILGSNVLDIQRPHWTPVRDMLGEISRSRALQGFSASETATFVFSIKQPIFA